MPTFRVRRRPRDPREGWEVLLDGEWCDFRDAGTPDGASDRAVLACIENRSLSDEPDVAWPKGIAVEVDT
jgi:hypothetical protein